MCVKKPRGLQYLTSAKFSDFLTPSPLSMSQISWFCSFRLLFGEPPPPPHRRRHIWKPPKREIVLGMVGSQSIHYTLRLCQNVIRSQTAWRLKMWNCAWNSTEWSVLSLARFDNVFPCELRGPAWAVGSYIISQSARGTFQNIIFKTLRQIGRLAL